MANENPNKCGEPMNSLKRIPILQGGEEVRETIIEREIEEYMEENGVEVQQLPSKSYVLSSIFL